jgi:hypothetical protein
MTKKKSRPPSPNERRIIEFLQYVNAWDTVPKIQRQSWDDFIETLKKPDTYPDVHGKTANDTAKKEGPGISFAVYNSRQARRNNGNVTGMRGMLLDLEEYQQSGKHPSRAWIKAVLAGTVYFVYSTNQHTPDRPRYRVVIYFSREVTVEEYLHLYDYFAARFAGVLDHVSKGLSTMAFLPRVPESRREYFEWFEGKGEFLDPRPLIMEAEQSSQSGVESNKGKATGYSYDDSNIIAVAIETLRITPYIKHLIKTGDASAFPGRDRSAMVATVVRSLLRYNKGISDETIAGVLFNSAYGISQRHYEKNRGPAWLRQDIARIRSLAQKWLIEDIDPYYREPHPLPLEEAKRRLKKEVTLFFQGHYSCLGIKASAGLGKTHAVLACIAQRQAGQGLVEIYVPTHKLAQEVATKLKQLAPQLAIQVIAGRSHREKKNAPTLCARAELAARLSQQGLSVYSKLCNDGKTRCPFFSSCRYLAQFNANTDVRILTHSYLPLPRGLVDDRQPDYVVIDESFFKVLLDIETYDWNDLRKSALPDDLKAALHEGLSQGLPLFQVLTQRFDDLTAYLNKVQASLRTKGRGSTLCSAQEVKPDMSDSDIQRLLRGHRRYTFENKLLSALLKEYQTLPSLGASPERCDQSFTVRTNGRKGFAICLRKSLKGRFTFKKDGEERRVPILCIDADLHEAINCVFLQDLQIKSIEVKRNVRVVQCSSTRNSKLRFTLTAETMEEVRIHRHNTLAIVRQYYQRANGRGVLVVFYKNLGDAKRIKTRKLKNKGFASVGNKIYDIESLHFGALRGVDKFKDFEFCIVIGRHQLPVAALENMAAALWWDQSVPLKLPGEFVEERRGYCMRNQTRCGVWVSVHPDPQVQALQEILREGETLQALDRLRLIHTPTPKTVVILSNLPLPLVVDQLISYRNPPNTAKSNKIEQLIDGYPDGVIPLAPELLWERHAELFGSYENAKQIVSRFKNKHFSGQGASQHYLYMDRLFGLVKYKLAKAGRGQPKSCLAETHLSAHQIADRLRHLHGTAVTVIKP